MEKKHIKALVCSHCGALLDPPGAGENIITCNYCGTSFKLAFAPKASISSGTPSNADFFLQEPHTVHFSKTTFHLSEVTNIFNAFMLTQDDIPEDFLIHTTMKEVNLVPKLATRAPTPMAKAIVIPRQIGRWSKEQYKRNKLFLASQTKVFVTIQ